MWAHPVVQNLTAFSCMCSGALLAVQSSMGLTQPTWTCHTLLSPLKTAQQGTLSVWYWGKEWTLQLCTTTLCLQLVGTSRCQYKETLQLHNIVSIDRRYLIFMGLSLNSNKVSINSPNTNSGGREGKESTVSVEQQTTHSVPSSSRCSGSTLSGTFPTIFPAPQPSTAVHTYDYKLTKDCMGW